jgi:hypothetical protein
MKAFAFFIQVTLIILKLTGVISISWWIVFIPSYLFVLGMVMVLGVALWAALSQE